MEKHLRSLLIMMLAFLLSVSGFKTVKADNHQEILHEKSELNAMLDGQMLKDSEPEYLYDDDEIVRISIILDSPSVLEKGYSPAKLSSNSQAFDYMKKLDNQQKQLISEARLLLQEQLIVKARLSIFLNAVSVSVRYKDIAKIKNLPGVKKVIFEDRYAIDVSTGSPVLSTVNSAFNYSNAIPAWNAGYTGVGRRIAIIDTGIDPEHISFNKWALQYSVKEYTSKYGVNIHLMDEDDLDTLKQRFPLHSEQNEWDEKGAIYVNEKIPFAYNYAHGDQKYSHDGHDTDCHGTHVAGIAAANKYIAYEVTENDDYDEIVADDGVTHYIKYKESLLDKGCIGMAYDAQLVVMNVFEGIYTYDGVYMAAIEDAMMLGCDSCNLSLGSGNGRTYINEYDRIMRELVSDFNYSRMIVCMAAGNEYNQIRFLTDECDMDGDFYIEDIGIGTPGKPAVYVNSLAVASVIDSTERDANGDPITEMNLFSSWGPNGSLLLKPEITATGGHVYSAMGYGKIPGSIEFIYDHTSYNYMNGTSMASPCIAGYAAVVKQYVEDNHIELPGYTTRALVQSLLMSTAVPMKFNGLYTAVLNQGAGLVNAGNAVNASTIIMMDENDSTLTAWTGAAKDGKVKAELGAFPKPQEEYSYSFRIYNISGNDVPFEMPWTDVFTQGYRISEDGRECITSDTAPAGSQVGYTWNINGVKDDTFDVNYDGDTDTYDANAILDYLTGNTSENNINLRTADMDNDGEITSYDAHLLLKYVEEKTYVPAKGFVDVLVAFSFNVNSDIYRSGAFMEGFTYVAEKNGVIHSIPILGYYGDWTVPSMFEHTSTIDQLYENENAYSYYFSHNDIILEKDGVERIYQGNPYTVENSFPSSRSAISTDTIIKSAELSFIRESACTAIKLTKIDEVSGKQVVLDVKQIDDPDSMKVMMMNEYQLPINISLSDYNLREGDRLKLELTSVTEYSILMFNYDKYKTFNRDYTGIILPSDLEEFLDQLNHTEGNTLTFMFTIDNTAPVLSGAGLNMNTEKISFNISDNYDIAYIGVLGPYGTVKYDEAVPAQDEFRYSFSISDLLDLGVYAVDFIAADYAGNETIRHFVLQERDSKQLSSIIDNEQNALYQAYQPSEYTTDQLLLSNYNVTYTKAFAMYDNRNRILRYLLRDDRHIEAINEYNESDSVRYLSYDYVDIAPTTVIYQREGWKTAVAIYDRYINLVDLTNGEVYFTENLRNYINSYVYMFCAGDISGEMCDYYAMDENGGIWLVTIMYGCGNNNIKDCLDHSSLYSAVKLFDTNIKPAKAKDGIHDDMYYGGGYIYWKHDTGTSVDLLRINVRTGLSDMLGSYPEEYDFTTLSADMEVPGMEGAVPEYIGNAYTNPSLYASTPNKTDSIPQLNTIIHHQMAEREVTIKEVVPVTNGVIKVNYEDLSGRIERIECDAPCSSVNIDYENRIVTFAYASASDINVEEVIASIHVIVTECLGGDIHIIKTEKNNMFDLNEQNTLHIEGEHKWQFGKFEWRHHHNTHSAFVLFHCPVCGSDTYQEMHVQKVSSELLRLKNRYDAYLSAEESLDGNAYTDTYYAIEKIPFPGDLKPVKRKWDDIIKPITVIKEKPGI